MYTAKQISEVLETFDRIGSITTVIRQLGYPSLRKRHVSLRSQSLCGGCFA